MKFVRFVVSFILLALAQHALSKAKLKQNPKEHLRKYSNGSFKPIRIRYIWANQDLGNTMNTYSQAQYDKLYKLYLADLGHFFQKFLSVYPFNSKVNKIRTSPKEGCKVGEAVITPERLMKDIEGFDYVFYVNTAPIPNKPSAKASAKSCAFSTFGSNPSYTRPVGGLINVQPSFYRIDDDSLSEFDKVSRKKTMIHESTHALTFAEELINKYIDDEGKDIPDDLLIKNVTLADQKTIAPYLIDSRMKAVVSDYYSCPNPVGYPLHVNKAHFHLQPLRTGIMKPADNDQSRISIFLLTLYDISGWYIVNKEAVLDKTLWGKGRGCKFINSLACEDEKGQRYPEYCPNDMVNNGTWSCDFNYDSRGPCLFDEVNDYYTICPSIIPNNNYNCFDPADIDQRKKKWEFYGRQDDSVGKCFTSDVSSICLRSKCNEHDKSITTFIEDKTYTATYTTGVRNPEFLIHEASNGKAYKYYFPESWERFCFTILNPEKRVNRKKLF